MKVFLKRMPVGLCIIFIGILPILLQGIKGVVFNSDLLTLGFPLVGIFGGVLYILAGFVTCLLVAFFLVGMILAGGTGLGALAFYGVLIAGTTILVQLRHRWMVKRLQQEHPLLEGEEAESLVKQAEESHENLQQTMLQQMQVYEAQCIAEGRCHLYQRRAKLLHVFREGDFLYFCAIQEQKDPACIDDKDTPGGKQLEAEKHNFKLSRSEIASVTIKECIAQHATAQKQLQITFHTQGKNIVMYDGGFVEGPVLERVLREKFELQVEPAKYTSVPKNLLEQKEKQPPMDVLHTLAIIAALWLVFYPNPMLLALGINLLFPALIFFLDFHKDVDGSAYFGASAAALIWTAYAFFRVMLEKGRYMAFLQSVLPITIGAWIAITTLLYFLGRHKQRKWKSLCIQAIYSFAYALGGGILLLFIK